MGFFKNLFGKQEPAWKSRKPMPNNDRSSEEVKATSPDMAKDHIATNEKAPTKSIIVESNPMTDKQNADKTSWLNTNNEILDENLVNNSLEILFPRLKRGHVGTPREQKMILPTKEGNKEVTLPPEMMMAGFDSGPDFSTCFAIDHEAMFTMIYNKHITLSGKSKEELLRIACNNYTRIHGPKMSIGSTIFEGVYELKTDGNSEASAFLFPQIWNNIMEQLKWQTLYMIIPAQNTVLFWQSIDDETQQTMISKVSDVVNTYPKGSLVSNYLYQFVDNAFEHKGIILDIKI